MNIQSKILLFVHVIIVSSIGYSCAAADEKDERAGLRAASASAASLRGGVGVEEQLRNIRAIDRAHEDRKNIIILGAGMAGLVAAHELLELGHTVTVIEASHREGGRAWTHEFSSTGQYHELGAMRIPASHDYTRHYINKCRLPLRRFISSHDEENCFYHFREKVAIRGLNTHGAHTIELSDATLDRYPGLSLLERKIASSHLKAPGILGSHLDPVIRALSADDEESLWGERPLTAHTARLENLSLGAFLDQCGVSPDAKELMCASTGLGPWMHIALTLFIREELTRTGYGLQEIVGGTERLPEALLGITPGLTRGGNLSLGTEVTSISLRDDGKIILGRQEVTTQKSPSGRWEVTKGRILDSLEADHVICTIPFSVLRAMKLEGFSHHKMNAIRNLHYESSTKVLLNCTTRFWEAQGIFGGASHSDHIIGATYYPSDNPPLGQPSRKFLSSAGRGAGSSASTDDDSRRRATTTTLARPAMLQQQFYGLFTRSSLGDAYKASEIPVPAASITRSAASSQLTRSQAGVLVGSYCWGRDAHRLGALAPVERAEVVVRTLESFHPNIRQHLSKTPDWYETMNWDEYPWSRGAFSSMQPNDLRDHYHAAIQPEGNVHFAGEHCSLDQAWIQGAIKSALRAVEEIVNS